MSEPAQRPGWSRLARIVFAAAAVATVAAAVVITWMRLFSGMDLQDESFYVLVPWRWALGDAPFVHEQNPAQIAGFAVYPFVKLFAVLRDYDVTGYVLYMRHLYLAMMIGVALGVFLLLRRLVRWELAGLVAVIYVTYIFWATPQLSYNTIGLAFLTLGAALAARTLLGGRRWFALGSGIAFGVAVTAYPSLLFVVPFYAVFLAFAFGRRTVGIAAQGKLVPPDAEGPATGRDAWRALSAWVAGGALVLVPFVVMLLGLGTGNLVRSWQSTMEGPNLGRQLGGSAKALIVEQSFWRFIASQPYYLVGALVVYLVYLRYPRLGRALLALLPISLYQAATRPMLWGSGFVLAYALVTLYLFLFIPQEKREDGARLLIWIWAPAMLAGVMAAYTSAAGYVNAAVGMAPALMVGGLYLAWSLETVTRAGEAVLPAGAPSGELPAAVPGRSRLPWLALVVLIVVVGVSLAVQFQIQQRLVPRSQLTSRFDSGPWWGIKVTPERRRQLDQFAADLRDQSRPGDALTVMFESPGYYLYWNGEIAANTYWIVDDERNGRLPQRTVSYFRRHQVAPTLVLNLMGASGATDADLDAASGGLGYPPTLLRAGYVFLRRPAGETTAQVLERLP